tara:strand:+ start:284 stop:514 length:231 start_codon:yes stop_codon:yes gene_type:complete
MNFEPKYVYPNKYPFYVLDIKENRIINGFTNIRDCKEFIIDLIPISELTESEIYSEKLNYKILNSNLNTAPKSPFY